jgi:hypothetical protein
LIQLNIYIKYYGKNRASENPINNKQSQLKRKQMAKTWPGTSKPSGAGVGKGGPKQSPTGGNTTKGKGGMKKGGSVKKGK